MTLQEVVLLNKLKKVQQTEAYCIEIDNLNCMISTCLCDKEVIKTISLDSQWDSVFSRVFSLEKKGYLSIVEEKSETWSFIVKLTHDGFHYLQTLMLRAADSLTKSVVLPIIVAIATTLLTLWIRYRLGLSL